MGTRSGLAARRLTVGTVGCALPRADDRDISYVFGTVIVAITVSSVAALLGR
jgi:hypothetical protein